MNPKTMLDSVMKDLEEIKNGMDDPLTLDAMAKSGLMREMFIGRMNWAIAKLNNVRYLPPVSEWKD